MEVHPLKIARIKNGISQLELARLLKTTDTRVSLVERGYALFTETEKAWCSEFFSTPVLELFPEGERQ